MLGSLILYLKGMRKMMFQLSGFYCNDSCRYLCLKPHVLGIERVFWRKVASGGVGIFTFFFFFFL